MKPIITSPVPYITFPDDVLTVTAEYRSETGCPMETCNVTFTTANGATVNCKASLEGNTITATVPYSSIISADSSFKYGTTGTIIVETYENGVRSSTSYTAKTVGSPRVTLTRPSEKISGFPLVIEWDYAEQNTTGFYQCYYEITISGLGLCKSYTTSDYTMETQTKIPGSALAYAAAIGETVSVLTVSLTVLSTSGLKTTTEKIVPVYTPEYTANVDAQVYMKLGTASNVPAKTESGWVTSGYIGSGITDKSYLYYYYSVTAHGSTTESEVISFGNLYDFQEEAVIYVRSVFDWLESKTSDILPADQERTANYVGHYTVSGNVMYPYLRLGFETYGNMYANIIEMRESLTTVTKDDPASPPTVTAAYNGGTLDITCDGAEQFLVYALRGSELDTCAKSDQSYFSFALPVADARYFVVTLKKANSISTGVATEVFPTGKMRSTWLDYIDNSAAKSLALVLENEEQFSTANNVTYENFLGRNNPVGYYQNATNTGTASAYLPYPLNPKKVMEELRGQECVLRSWQGGIYRVMIDSVSYAPERYNDIAGKLEISFTEVDGSPYGVLYDDFEFRFAMVYPGQELFPSEETWTVG